MSATITESGAHIDVRAPFNSDANTDYRKIGGKWKDEVRAWRFDARDLERVREVLVRHFGRDDREPASTVTVRITDPYSDKAELRMFGRTVASRCYRDDTVRLGEGVVIIEAGHVDTAALAAEREQLLARLAEIDKALAPANEEA